MASSEVRSHCSTTVRRMLSCRRFSGSSRFCGLDTLGINGTHASGVLQSRLSTPEACDLLSVMHRGEPAQFRRFLFGGSIAEKDTAANLRPGQILQEIRPSQRRVKLDMKMKAAIIAAVGRRLMQRHDVWK